MEKQHSFIEKKAVFSIFRDLTEVKKAEKELLQKGFLRSDISVMYPQSEGSQDFPQRQRSSIGKGSLIGAIVGGLIFVTVSVLMSLRIIPAPWTQEAATFQISQIVWIAISLLGGIVVGAASGALVGIGTPESAGLRYGDYIDAGGILISVHVNNAEETRQAQEALEKCEGQDISVLTEGDGWKNIYSKIVENNLSPNKNVELFPLDTKNPQSL